MALPRGIRLSNPGNIDKGPTAWQGEIRPGQDARFCTFTDPKYGLRAIMVLLRRYYYVRNLTTVRQIVSTWAPGTENNTGAYVNDVAARMNVNADAPLLICPETDISFAQAITRHENGVPPIIFPTHWYADDVYQAACELAMPNAVQTA